MGDPMPNQQLLTAIDQKRLIGLSFNGRVRIAEPHDYGIRNGRETLLAYQLEPETDWRWFAIEKMSDLTVLEQPFRGGRPAPSGKHHVWDRLFARVGKKDKDKVKTKKKTNIKTKKTKNRD